MARDPAGGRGKVFVGFRDLGEKRVGTPLLRTLMALAFQRGEAAAQAKQELPPSFVELFGAGAVAVRQAGNGGAFDPLSDGGALRRREAALLKHLGGGAAGLTARLKESVVADIACVASLPNPATAPDVLGDSGTKAGGGKAKKGAS